MKGTIRWALLIVALFVVSCGSPTDPPPQSCLQFAGRCDLGLDSLDIDLPDMPPDTVWSDPKWPDCGKGHLKAKGEGHDGKHGCDGG